MTTLYATLGVPSDATVDEIKLAEHAAEEAQARQAQEEARRVAQEHYEEMVAIAMRFVEDGHGRDVLFGVLLGKDCETELAERIADSVWALHESRKAASQPDAVSPSDAGTARTETPPSAFETFWHGLFGFR
jgi:hypothetical protein